MRRLVLAAAMAAMAGAGAAEPSSVMGVWLSASGVAHIELAPCADPARGPVCSTIVKLIDPKAADGRIVPPETVTDVRNADPALRGRKTLGTVMVYDMKRTSEPTAFEGGTIYNGENGKTYNANLRLEPDGRLRLRGYVGTPMFGETQYWTRVR